MDLLGALGALVRVAETGSFSAVARERQVSQSAVTRQIALLEQHFAVRLFHRTTRRLSLTDDGERLLGHARMVLNAVEGMEEELGHQSSTPTGLVRVGVRSAGARFLATRVPQLLARHPGLKIELVVHDRFGDMIEERLDLALHYGDLHDSSLRVRRVRMIDLAVVAAPAYLKEHGVPLTPADLADHTCLIHDSGPDSDLWHFTNGDETVSVRVSGSFIANNTAPIRVAARAGYGIAMLPELQVVDDVHTGELVHLLSKYPSQRVPLCLVYPSRRNLASRTRVVMDFLLEESRQLSTALAAGSDVTPKSRDGLSFDC
jgi:DNA-binding transcriptional LysR family regulator